MPHLIIQVCTNIISQVFEKRNDFLIKMSLRGALRRGNPRNYRNSCTWIASPTARNDNFFIAAITFYSSSVMRLPVYKK